MKLENLCYMKGVNNVKKLAIAATVVVILAAAFVSYEHMAHHNHPEPDLIHPEATHHNHPEPDAIQPIMFTHHNHPEPDMVDWTHLVHHNPPEPDHFWLT